MKRIILLLIVFVACRLSAQEFHLIPKVGLNLAGITGESDNDGSIRPGLNMGLGVDVMWNQRIGVETGVYYSMQGNKSKGGKGGYISYTTILDYINLPVYVKGNIYKGLYLFAGPQFGFNIIQKSHSSSDAVPSLTIDMNVIRKFDCSLGIGAGYQWKCGLLVSANYNFGLTDAWKSSIDWADRKKSCNNVCQLNVGWAFKL